MTIEIVATKAGAVEVEVHGSGLPVLVLHGSPGGVDAAIAMSRFLGQDNFKMICLSRPGYLGTPLDLMDASIDHEADFLAAVLDAISVDRVGVLAWSGGGAAAYRFAVRHPSRVSAVVAIAAVSSRWEAPKPSVAERLVFGTAIGERLVTFLTKQAPRHVVKGALENEGSVRGEDLDLLVDHVMADPEQCRLILEIAPTANSGGKRHAGWQNDVANFARITSLELERVACPVLLIHGDADTDAVPEFSRSAHAKLTDSALIEMNQGTHLSFYAHPEASDVQEKARKWFFDHSEQRF